VLLRLHNVGRTEDVTDLPVMVRVAEVVEAAGLDPATLSLGLDDLRFTDDDGVTILPHEVERLETADGGVASAHVWLRVPHVPAFRSDDFVWMYWGNAGAPNAEDAAGVWQSGFEAVFHLDEGTPVDAGPDASSYVGYEDSTGNGHTARVTAGASRGGVSGDGLSFSAATELVVPSLHSPAFPSAEGTIEIFAYRDWDGQTPGPFFDAPDGSRSQLVIDLVADDVRARASVGDGGVVGTSTSAPSNNSWRDISAAWDTAAGTYNFGAPYAGVDVDVPGWAPSDQRFQLGGVYAGGVDEVRLSNVARSSHWRSAAHAAAGGGMIIVGPPPVPPDTPTRTLPRATLGLVQYELNEGAGSIVADTGSGNFGLDLTIRDPERTSWVEGGLWVQAATIVESADAATGLTDACVAAGAFSIEAWVATDSEKLGGPARMITVSQDSSFRNFTFGQDASRYVLRLRNTDTNTNGSDNTTSSVGRPHTGYDSIIPGGLQHVVFTWGGAGTARTYLDGEIVDTRDWPGALTPWDNGWRLGLANEFNPGGTPSRPWLGALYFVAVYCAELGAADVATNFAAGP
jgi:hypothetical protein